MSDELKLLLNAIISNQEHARAKQEAFEYEMLGFRKEVNKRFDEVDKRFDYVDGEIRSIKRHIATNERELDSTITRVEKLEQNANH